MTYDELKQKVTDLVMKPDTAAAELPDILDSLKVDYELHAGAVAKMAEQEERIRTLQEGNNRLLLMTLGERSEPAADDEDKTPKTFADMVEARANEMKGESNG